MKFVLVHTNNILLCKLVRACLPPFVVVDVYKRQIVEKSKSVGFGEYRLRERGSLPATFYVLTRVKYLKIYLN